MSYGNQSETDKIILDATVTQDVNLNVATTDKDIDIDKSERTDTYNLNVHAPEKPVYVKVDIKEEVHRDERSYSKEEDYKKTEIVFTEDMKKDIDISTWNVEVDVKASSIIQNSEVQSDMDVNDLQTSSLINVAPHATLNMDDFNLDVTAIGDSFNGAGNDSYVSVNQSNELDDNDEVRDTQVAYRNEQAPNVDASLDASYKSKHEAEGGGKHEWEYEKESGGYSHKDWMKPKPEESASGSGSHWWSATASSAAALTAELSLTAPTEAFQTVEGTGGTAVAGDGIGTADLHNTNSDNEGDGTVSGDAAASADGIASAEAFTSSIMAGGNQQANFATLKVVGGDELNAGDIKGYHPGSDDDGGAGGHSGYGGGLAIKDSKVSLDDDLNDLDTSNLINVQGNLNMDDFDLDMDAIASSFNGPGNDMAFDINQTNDLVDQDTVYGTNVTYQGAGWNGPFQSVMASGGSATAGSGIGSITGHGVANSNGGDGSILGSTSATADALASAEAFTSNIVVGANLQVNNLSATIVGGDSTMVDDIGLGH
ncbi:MAG: hypothetical protein ACKVP7_21480 [Hyphomicrobiaceae bacterium]